MAALAWLVVGALTFSALFFIAGEVVRDNVAHALYVAQPTQAESDAAWDREIDESIAPTVPLHESEVAARIAAIIAFNEAARHDPDAFDWTSPARRVE